MKKIFLLISVLSSFLSNYPLHAGTCDRLMLRLVLKITDEWWSPEAPLRRKVKGQFAQQQLTVHSILQGPNVSDATFKMGLQKLERILQYEDFKIKRFPHISTLGIESIDIRNGNQLTFVNHSGSIYILFPAHLPEENIGPTMLTAFFNFEIERILLRFPDFNASRSLLSNPVDRTDSDLVKTTALLAEKIYLSLANAADSDLSFFATEIRSIYVTKSTDTSVKIAFRTSSLGTVYIPLNQFPLNQLEPNLDSIMTLLMANLSNKKS